LIPLALAEGAAAALALISPARDRAPAVLPEGALAADSAPPPVPFNDFPTTTAPPTTITTPMRARRVPARRFRGIGETSLSVAGGLIDVIELEVQRAE